MRLDVAGFCLLFGALSLSAHPEGARAQAVRGPLVYQDVGTPVAPGRLTLVDADGQPVVFTIPDIEGRFLVTAPGPGEYRLTAESTFYNDHSDRPLSLSPGDTMLVRFSPSPEPVELTGLVVEVPRGSMRLILGGYYEREETGLGWYLNRERIRPYRQMSDLLASVPGVDIRLGTEPVFRQAQIFSRMNKPGAICYPQVYLNGSLFGVGGNIPTNIDRLVRPRNVEAVEVYTSQAWMPGRFAGQFSRCGAVVIWTQ